MTQIKFLIDENVGQAVIKYIKSKNFDTIVVNEEFTGRDDIFLIKKAFSEKRIIITNDKDFGYLCFKGNYPTAGVILFRLAEEDPVLKVKSLDCIFTERMDCVYNYFIVISSNKIRFRKINPGNLGIGTTSPSAKLSVGEKVLISDSINPSNPPAGGVVIYFDGTDLVRLSECRNITRYRRERPRAA